MWAALPSLLLRNLSFCWVLKQKARAAVRCAGMVPGSQPSWLTLTGKQYMQAIEKLVVQTSCTQESTSYFERCRVETGLSPH